MTKKICPVCGRLTNSKHKDNYCSKHNNQRLKYGKVLDHNPRTKFDPNEFRIKGNLCEMDTYDLSGNVRNTYIFDAEDYLIVSKYKWNTNKYGYARAKGTSILLHRLIMGCPPGSQVDHINLNIKDNRKINLRICQNGVNNANKRPYNKYNIKGIEQHRSGKWSAYIRKDNKQYHSPVFDTKEEAAFARYILEQFIYPNDILTQHHTVELEQKLKEKVIKRVIKKLQN